MVTQQIGLGNRGLRLREDKWREDPRRPIYALLDFAAPRLPCVRVRVGPVHRQHRQLRNSAMKEAERELASAIGIGFTDPFALRVGKISEHQSETPKIFSLGSRWSIVRTLFR
jgi:hypothetical protein